MTPASTPYATAFESSPTPALALAGSPQRVVALNAAARTLLGDPTGEPLSDALPGAAPALYDACERVARTGRPERAAVEAVSPGSARTLPASAGAVLSPWRQAPGECGGLVAHLPGLVEPRSRGVSPAGLLEATLPTEVPLFPGLDVAAAYALADEDGIPRGDWFDVWAVGGSCVAAGVGDVVGHGVGAVAAMTALRAVLHERLASGAGPAAAVEAADRLARDLPGTQGASTCVVLVDVAGGRATYCTAGHPPPLVAGGDGPATYLDPTGAPTLGSGSGRPAAGTVRLEPGEVLLLYTDGAVSPGRGGRAAVSGLAGLAGAATRAASSDAGRSQDVLRACLLAAAGTEEGTVADWEDAVEDGLEPVLEPVLEDDVALVALQRVPPPAVLRLEVGPTAASVTRVRHELGHWLDRLGVRDLDELALQHVVTELVANAVLHAGGGDGERDRGGQVSVAAELVPRQVVLTVCDPGPWVPPSADGDGRGLVIARELADRLDVVHRAGGTEVRAVVPVGRPAGLSRSSGPPVPAVRQQLVLEGGDGSLRAVGTLDLVSRDRLREHLLARTQGGTRPVRLDLSGLSLLDSAAVRTLREVGGWRAGGQPVVRLVAAPGSRAHHVLSVAGVGLG